MTEASVPPTDMTAAPAGAGAGGTGAEPYRVLARKYRPQNFDELVGQEALVQTLTNAIETGRIAHAFILTGVRGIGKTTTARIIARALNCIGPDGKGGPTAHPCGVCVNCRAIADDRHVDVIEMDAASRTGVDDMRELIEGVRYKPVSARYKVYIIDEVHMLSKSAFNALLKTLEEPPEHVKFVFATTEIRKVPVTVLSRCQRFDLRRLDQELLAKHLGAIAAKEGARVEPEALALLARAADGSVRDGLSLLDQAIAHAVDGTVGAQVVRDMLGLADRSLVLDLFDGVMRGDVKGALAQVASMYRAGADPLVVVQDLLDIAHWLTRLKIVPDAAEGLAVSEAERGRAADMAGRLAMASLGRAWQMLLKGLGEVQYAPQPLAALEMLLVRLAYAAELPAPADLVKTLAAGGTVAAPAQPAAPSAPRPAAPRSDAASQPTAAMSGAPARGALAARPIAEPEPAPPPMASAAPSPAPRTFEEIVALFEAKREGMLHHHLVESVHLVRCEPGLLEFRPEPSASDNLANRVGQLLGQWTGRRWMVTVSREPGAPTLGEQRRAAELAVKRDAAQLPLVRAVLEAFPGAAIEAVREVRRATGADAPTQEHGDKP
jgi:DNA polymerase-3 subunit gamma/tau